MYKKLLLIIPLFVGIGCCTDIKDHFNIEEFSLQVRDTNQQPLSTPTITADSLLLLIDFFPDFVQNGFSFNLFMNKALALSCEEPGQQGMDDKISEIVITSDHEFNGITAGEPINQFIETFPAGMNLDDFTTFYGSQPYDFTGNIYLVITEKPTQPDHTFKMKMEFESGRSAEGQAGRVVWN